ncbi:MAG: DUF2345 domain-containing protein, partial [Proteobacteria bacterium]|nr:DUF2345 domain-containing protein [Pseudomonadota bacterium]
NAKFTAIKGKGLFNAKQEILLTAGGAYIRIKDGKIELHAPGKVSIKGGSHDWGGPASMNVAPPVFPKSSIPFKKMAFNLRLADTPGPQGHVLAFAPWKIAVGDKPDGMALVHADQLLTEGVSDEAGKVLLSTDQEETLSKAYCANPSKLWLLYPGHIVNINIEEVDENWSDEDKLMHALNAADFSQQLHPFKEATGAMDHRKYAKDAFSIKKSTDIYDQFKKQ